MKYADFLTLYSFLEKQEIDELSPYFNPYFKFGQYRGSRA